MAATLPLTGDGNISQNSGTPADGTYKLTNASSGAGKKLTIEGSNAAAGSNAAGGDIELKVGLRNGTSTTSGKVQITAQPWSSNGHYGRLALGDQNHWIQGEYGFGIKIATIGANEVISIKQDTGYVGLGTMSPTGRLHVDGGTAASGYDGTDITLKSQAGSGSAKNGGWIVLDPGAGSSGGLDGSILLGGYGATAKNGNLIVSTLRYVGIHTDTPVASLTICRDSNGPGTVGITNGSNVITGTGTTFFNSLRIGDTITVSGQPARTITNISSDTSATVNSAYGSTTSGLSYALSSGYKLMAFDNGCLSLGNTTFPLQNMLSIDAQGLDSDIMLCSNAYYNTMGIDVSDSYKFKITSNNNLSSNELFTIDRSGNVGIGTTSPATSAKLELSSTTGALLLTRMTTTQRNALTAVAGMVIFNTTTGTFQGCTVGGGTPTWVNL